MDSVGIRRSRMYTRPPEFSSFCVKESPPMNLETPTNRIYVTTIFMRPLQALGSSKRGCEDGETGQPAHTSNP